MKKPQLVIMYCNDPNSDLLVMRFLSPNGDEYLWSSDKAEKTQKLIEKLLEGN